MVQFYFLSAYGLFDLYMRFDKRCCKRIP